MSATIVGHVDAWGVKSMLQKYEQHLGNMRPALEVIGQTVLDDGVRQAFRDQESPNGVPWPPLTPEYLAQREGKGDHPLQRTGALRNSFNWQLTPDGKGVSVGTPFEFFKYHQHLAENEHLNKGIMPERAAIPKLTATGALPSPLRGLVLDALVDHLEKAAKGTL